MAKKRTTRVNFPGLLADMKRQPKDSKGRFKDRDFAKYVSRQLAEVRKYAKPFKKAKKTRSKQLKIKFKRKKQAL